LFDPGAAGLGTHSITYSYTDNNSCDDSASIDIVVNDEPNVTLDAAGPLCIDANSIQLNGLPAGGTYSGTGVSVSGLFDPVAAGLGTHSVTYSYTDNNSCDDSASIDISVIDSVNAGEDGALEVCSDDDGNYNLSDFIYDEESGGSWTGPNGAHDGVFNAQEDQPGQYTYTVSGTDPCPDDSSIVSVSINPLPPVQIDAQDPLCIDDDPVQLTVNFDGGTWSGNGVDENGVFDPAIAGPGEHSIRYDYASTSSEALVISAAYDGPLTGGIPKGVELYVLNDIDDLSIYGFGSANNAGGSDGEEFTFPAVSASAGDRIYLASESTAFTTFFGFAPDYTSSAANINGDDSLELFKNGTVIDVFGVVGVDGTNDPWEYLDGWAYRKANTGPDGSTFDLNNWYFSGKNAFDGETTNDTAETPMPVGLYFTANCSNYDKISVQVNDLPELELVGEPVCDEAENFGTYSVEVITNTINVTSDFGVPNDNGGGSWTIVDIPNGQDAIITAFDEIGCDTSINVSAPECICIELEYDFTNVTCVGEDDGTITVNFLTEGAIVTINGSPYAENATYPPGLYTIIAFFDGVDLEECIITEQFEITEPGVVTMDVTSTNISCNGVDDGTITVSNLSEGATYTIQLNGYGADLSGQSTFAPGTYLVVAFIDNASSRLANNEGIKYAARYEDPCEEARLVTIEEYTCEIIRGYPGKLPSCKPSKFNFLQVNTTGGSGELTYAWSIDIQSMNNGWGIIGDSDEFRVSFTTGYDSAYFTVTITDEEGCVTQCNIKQYSNCSNPNENNFRIEPLDFSVHPNPTKGSVNVKFNKEVASDMMVEVYNLIGTQMYQRSYSQFKGASTVVDFSGLPGQVYYLRITTAHGVQTKKVILDK